MPRIFISYRREDSEHIAGRLFDRLEAHFGRENLFMDIDTIPFGVDFRHYLDEAVGQCDILLAVIGKDWLEARNQTGTRQGERRLEDPADFVAIEIGSALARKIPVIPVLVAGALMPAESQLPDSLKGLAYRNAAEVRSGRDFRDHVDRLIRGIEHLDGQQSGRRQAERERQRRDQEEIERRQRETEEPPPDQAAPHRSPKPPGGDKPSLQAEKGPRKGQPFTNSVGMKFVWIEPGSFLMGSPDGERPPGVPAEEKRAKNETPHAVTLTKGHHLGKHLVTQYQWEQVTGTDANHSNFKGLDDEKKKKLPVDNVSWFDCVEFCIKLNERESRESHYRLTKVDRNKDGSIKMAEVEILAGGAGYRLPTEAEWEYACRAGTKTAFWWGNTITIDQANYDGTYAYGTERKKGEFRRRTTPIDFFPANPWGLHDMHGNLYEWCQDWYGEDDYDESDEKDPIDPIIGAARILRGGCWFNDPRLCRAANRYWCAPAYRHGCFGCRLLLRLD